MNLLAELKRRNVIRMAGLYLVGAWLIIQIAETLLPIFETPSWVLKALVVLLAIGLLPALVFSWIYELTPDGLKRDVGVTSDAALAATTGKRMDRLILSGLAAVILVVAADRWWPRTQPATARDESTAQVPAVADEPAPAPGTDAPASPAALGIAVLPFDNFSPDPDNAYFASGVYEEVLTKLSRIGALRVISRTSMERIAREDLEVGAIGARLGVSHVLEGSVRRAGDQVRVTVQLIEAATDAHLWAESYDRNLDDVFAIQSEIALAIADQLKLSLSAQLQADLGERPTQNQAAYELYLKALDNNRTWRFADGYRDAIDLLEPAVRLDPDFLAAQVLLAEAYGRMYWLRADPDGRYLALARERVAHIGERWPDRAETELARAQLSYNIDRDYDRTLEAFEAVRLHLPNHPEVLRGISASLKRLGRSEEYLAAARLALAADPEAPVLHAEVLQALTHTRRYAEALAFGEMAERKFPDEADIAISMARVRAFHDQDLEPLLALGRRFGDNVSIGVGFEIALARFLRDDVDGALAAIESAGALRSSIQARRAAASAELLRLAGRTDEADTLARAAYARLRQVEDTYAPTVGQANLAWLAVEAGERDASLALQAKSNANPPISGEEQYWAAEGLSGAQRALGDPEAAWLLMQPFAGESYRFSREHLILFRPFYDRVFDGSRSYRAYMAGIEAQR
jgi:TolB-like protein